MKKNISVNMFGTLYNIDEDAYTLLQDYESSVRRYFERKGEDDEVAQDVERRVAELFEELRQQGIAAITIEHVQEIIRRIGKPGEMDGHADVEEDNGAQEQTSQSCASQPELRKLFRDPDDCMLGGVLAGMAHYFGGSPTALRVLVVAIALFIASIPWLIVCYLVACVLIPKAVTPEDKLRMMGKPVNLVSLGEGVINGVNEGVKNVRQRGCLDQLLGFIALIFKMTLFMCLGFVALIVGIILFLVMCALLIALAAGISSFTLGENAMFMFSSLNLPPDICNDITIASFWIMIIMMIVVCGIPLYAIVHLYRRFRGKEQPLSNSMTIACWLLWLVAIGLVISMGHSTWKSLLQANSGCNSHFPIRKNITVTVEQEPVDDTDSEAVAVSDTIY